MRFFFKRAFFIKSLNNLNFFFLNSSDSLKWCLIDGFSFFNFVVLNCCCLGFVYNILSKDVCLNHFSIMMHKRGNSLSLVGEQGRETMTML